MMTSTPLLTIITVCYNSAATIANTMHTVLNQDYGNIEYIVIDGASTDDTLAIINANKTTNTLIISEPDKGMYHALNKGIALAQGEIIGMLHADDFYSDTNVLSNVVKSMQVNNAQLLYANLLYVNAMDTNKTIRNWTSGAYTTNAFTWGWMPPHPTFFVRKNVYKQYGNFRLDMQSAADYELMLRLIHVHKLSINYLPQTIIKMRVGGVSNATLHNRIIANKADRKAWVVNNVRPYWFTLYLKPLRKIMQYVLR
jgi:glycosyltransferase involved in cell wall biosynthesis